MLRRDPVNPVNQLDPVNQLTHFPRRRRYGANWSNARERLEMPAVLHGTRLLVPPHLLKARVTVSLCPAMPATTISELRRFQIVTRLSCLTMAALHQEESPHRHPKPSNRPSSFRTVSHLQQAPILMSIPMMMWSKLFNPQAGRSNLTLPTATSALGMVSIHRAFA